MHCHCGTNNRAPRWTFTDPCKPEVRPGAREESATFIPAFTTNAITLDFLLLISHGWEVTFPDSHRTVFTFRSWLDLLGVVLAYWISILKISKLRQNYLHRVTDITYFEKTFGKFFRSYSQLLSKFGDISFQEYVSKGISHPVFYGDLVYKLRRVKHTPNFISSRSKIVKRLRRRHYDPMIIERTISLVLGPSTALYLSLSIALWLTRRWELYDGPCLNLLRGDKVLIFVPLIVSRDSYNHQTWARFQPGGA